MAVFDSDRRDGVRTALVVDRRVRHLETQLYVNRRRRAFFARIFGLDNEDEDEQRTHGRRARSSLLHPGNEYFDERCRLRMLNAGVGLTLPPPSSTLLASTVAPSSPVDPRVNDSELAASQHPQSSDQPMTLLPVYT